MGRLLGGEAGIREGRLKCSVDFSVSRRRGVYREGARIHDRASISDFIILLDRNNGTI